MTIITIISISFRLSISLPLVQPGCVLERVSAGVELADSESGSEVAQAMNIVVSNANTNTIAIECICISTPLAIVDSMQPGCVLERVSAGVELADSESGSEVAQAMNIVVSNACTNTIAIERISISLSLANIVSTTSIASGLDTVSIGCRPCGCNTAIVSISISFRGCKGGHSQAGDNQELLHLDDTTHRNNR